MNNTQHKYFVKPLAAAVTLMMASSIVSLPVSAASKPLHEDIKVSEYQGWGNPVMAGMAVNAGRSLINHLRSANALLTDGDTAQATNALRTSEEFTAALGRMMPYLRVVDEIKNASDKLLQEDVVTIDEELLPIYASLDDLAFYAPEVAKTTRVMIKRAGETTAAGNKRQAVEILKKAEDIIVTQTVYLPVRYVDQQLRVALAAMHQHKPDVRAAQQAVQRAMGSITTVVDEVIAPAGS